MITRTWIVVAACALLAPESAGQGRLAGGVHTDKVNGFSVRVPSKWEMVPVTIDEKWMVGKYISHRDYSNKGGGYAVSHRPNMKVMVFSAEKLKDREKRETVGNTTYVSSNKVFRNYKDYLREYMKGQSLGYHIADEKQTEVGGVPVTQIRAVAKTDWTSYVYITWIYDRREDGMTIAVQFDALEDRFSTLNKDFMKSLRSFRFIERTAEASSEDLENPMWTRDRSKWSKLKPEERIRIRRDLEERRRARYIETAPEGWFTMTSRKGDYVALSHADKKYTQTVLATADAMRAWMDKHFGDISDEYVMTGIIRICKDVDEYRSYRDTSASAGARSFSTEDREIVDFKDVNAGTSGGGLGTLAGGLKDNYIFDKDALLYGYMPLWVSTGLDRYFQSGVLKGRSLSFKVGTWEKVAIKEAKREGQLVSLQDIMTRTRYEWPSDRNEAYRYLAQVVGAIRFLVDGPGKRDKLLKGYLPKLMKATIPAAEAWRKESPAEGQAQTEEEEEARAREGNLRWKKARRFVLDRVNAECCDFTDKEWAKLNKLFERYLK